MSLKKFYIYVEFLLLWKHEICWKCLSNSVSLSYEILIHLRGRNYRPFIGIINEDHKHSKHKYTYSSLFLPMWGRVILLLPLNLHMISLCVIYITAFCSFRRWNFDSKFVFLNNFAKFLFFYFIQTWNFKPIHWLKELIII